MTLSGPNRMICEYFEALRRLVRGIPALDDVSHRKQQAALSILLAVAVVEAFLNVYFRVVVSEPDNKNHEQNILKDLDKRLSLDQKIKQWPVKILGRGIDFGSGVGRDFIVLKKKRNALMHFTSSHSTLQQDGITIHGLSDTSVYDQLSPRDAEFALSTAEGVVETILRLRGATAEQLPWFIQLWTGKVAI